MVNRRHRNQVRASAIRAGTGYFVAVAFALAFAEAEAEALTLDAASDAFAEADALTFSLAADAFADGEAELCAPPVGEDVGVALPFPVAP